MFWCMILKNSNAIPYVVGSISVIKNGKILSRDITVSKGEECFEHVEVFETPE